MKKNEKMSGQIKNSELSKSEPLVFINECLPQLAAGMYEVTANLEVNGEKNFKQVSKELWVDAPRFILEQSDIYSVYPPRGSSGHFETTLPHIVFNRRTLPWERTIDGKTDKETDFKDTRGHAPWMGLLLLNEDEIKGAAVTGNEIITTRQSLKDIFIKDTTIAKQTDPFVPEISGYGGVKPALSQWEDRNSICEVIDVPLAVFKTIMPQKDDLPFLAHVRKALVDANKESADIGDDGYFSTLISNRLPTRDPDESKSKKNTVFLVSLEGFHNYFKNPGYITQQKVRLVVLTSWSFTVAAGKNFKQLCEQLHVSPLKMNKDAVKNESLRTAYDYGYTLLPHKTRDGANTFSWYRGPFNPNFLPAAQKTKTFTSSDEALRFDHKTGLFDISYSAAWQLGRLLALKDKVFSNALYQWKIQRKRDVLKLAAKQQVNALLPKDFSPSKGTDLNSLEDLMKDFFLQKNKEASRTEYDPNPFSTKPGDISKQLDDMANAPVSPGDAPKEVRDWLGKLFLLNGVPLNYMIPHENYLINDSLEKEALGTFYIDYDWVEALLGGALSIVFARDSVALLNMLKEGMFMPDNLVKNKETASSLPTDEDIEIPLPKNITGHITGFFLRSELVSGWKGIKVFPKFPKNASGDLELFPLRIERIADDIKLCIFSGKVQEILIIQPPEGVHFGIDTGSDTKTLRKPQGDIDDSMKIKLAFRDNNKSKGVLELSKIANEMKRINAGDKAYSSADFAFQMLESPIMYVLKIED